MGYYQGDFYAGARGDPGIGSFFGSLVKGAVGLIPGVGGVVGRVMEKIPGLGSRAATAGAIVKRAGGVIMKHPAISAAGAAGIIGLGAAGASHMLGRKKRAVDPVTGKVRRRMNVCNPRALRRSIRRTHGFAKLAMRTIHLVHPKKKVRFGGFRKKKTHK